MNSLFRSRFTAFLLLILVGCASREVLVIDVIPASPPIPVLPGVDSVFIAMAEMYAQRGKMVDPRLVESSRLAVEGGRRLFEIADSLSAKLLPPKDSVKVTDEAMAESIRRYNAGAESLQKSNLGNTELKSAAEQFQLALEANPYDPEAFYWLSRVYEMQSERFMEAGATDQMIDVLSRLTDLYPLRHDYAGLLASAYEGHGTVHGWTEAGGWWHRASLLIRDEPNLSLDVSASLDTSTTFIYLANASRAFIEADEGELALAAIQESTPFAIGKEEQSYVEGEIKWLTWDAGISTRKQFDLLLHMSINDPAGAAFGLQQLVTSVTFPQAEVDVRHQLALALFNAGNSKAGIAEIRQAWNDAIQADSTLYERVREDYGTMAYSMAIEQREAGELRNALAYLLQSEATGFSGAPMSALTRSILLRTDPEAALEAAELAEAGWDELDAESRRTLLEHMVSLHRRLNHRDQAALYAQRYRDFVGR